MRSSKNGAPSTSSNNNYSYLSYLNPFSYFAEASSGLFIPEDLKKKPRKISSFEANKTPSLKLPDEITCVKEIPEETPPHSMAYSIFSSFASMLSYAQKPQPPKKERIVIAEDIHKKMLEYNQDPTPENIFKQVDLLKTEIEEHAARRVDLFLLLLLAVYKKNVILSKGETVKQHGKGSSTYGTQACHSSLLPNINIETPRASRFSFWSGAAPFVITGTQLEEILNMTVELPHIVNVFDGYIEGGSRLSEYTKASLNIANRVSRGEIDPRAGINEFLNVMDIFFIHFEKAYITSDKDKADAAMQLVWKHEKKGTFKATEGNTLMVSDAYFYAALELKPDEVAKLSYRSWYYLPYFYERVQNEILTSKPVEGKRHKKTI